MFSISGPLLIIPIVIGIYSIGFHQLLHASGQKSHTGKPHWVLIWSGAICFTLLWHGQGILMRFQQSESDSFFTLNQWQRIGLLIVSILLIKIFFLLSAIKTHWFVAGKDRVTLGGRSACLLDIAATWGIFTVLYPLAAQVYYTYYRAIIPDLPNQWVVKMTRASSVVSDFSLAGPALTLNLYLGAMTIWAAIFAVLWHHLGVSAKHPGKTPALVTGMLLAVASFLWLRFTTGGLTN